MQAKLGNCTYVLTITIAQFLGSIPECHVQIYQDESKRNKTILEGSVDPPREVLIPELPEGGIPASETTSSAALGNKDESEHKPQMEPHPEKVHTLCVWYITSHNINAHIKPAD